ncbi:hypothetical protein ACIG3E_18100 [Streptomyces sp. NPDC053474]|uniref:hypothetical protein n=1 Tax=Streptomyces sp. NPDC053474 TaxID=3365704 RepID=UPI0037D98648
MSVGDLIRELTLLESFNDNGRRTVAALRKTLMGYRQLNPLPSPPRRRRAPAPANLGADIGEVRDAYQASRFGFATRQLPLLLTDAPYWLPVRTRGQSVREPTPCWR